MNRDADNKTSLYPFLFGEKQNKEAQRNALLHSINSKAADSINIKKQFFDNNSQALVDTAETLAEVYRQNGCIFAMGNGGSSCDASHFCVEFQHPVTAGRPSLPAINLTMDTAMLSAVGNDVGIEQVFARQIQAHGKTNDALVGFSTSGNSTNLLNGFYQAKSNGLKCIGFCGGDGGEMLSSGLLDHCLCVETDSIHRVQEVHVSCYHIIWDIVHTLLSDSRGRI